MAKKKDSRKERSGLKVDQGTKRWLGGLLMGLGVAIALSVALDNPAVGIAVGVGVGTLLSLNLSGRR